jgi:hypothetical protein
LLSTAVENKTVYINYHIKEIKKKKLKPSCTLTRHFASLGKYHPLYLRFSHCISNNTCHNFKFTKKDVSVVNILTLCHSLHMGTPAFHQSYVSWGEYSAQAGSQNPYHTLHKWRVSQLYVLLGYVHGACFVNWSPSDSTHICRQINIF